MQKPSQWLLCRIPAALCRRVSLMRPDTVERRMLRARIVCTWAQNPIRTTSGYTETLALYDNNAQTVREDAEI